jgi:hypothetical protein
VPGGRVAGVHPPSDHIPPFTCPNPLDGNLRGGKIKCTRSGGKENCLPVGQELRPALAGVSFFETSQRFRCASRVRYLLEGIVCCGREDDHAVVGAENRRARIGAQCNSKTADPQGEDWKGTKRIKKSIAKTAVGFSSFLNQGVSVGLNPDKSDRRQLAGANLQSCPRRDEHSNAIFIVGCPLPS